MAGKKGKSGHIKGGAEVSLRQNPERQRVFLEALAATGNFRQACREASPHSKSANEMGCMTTFRNFIRDDPTFAARVKGALDDFKESLV